MLLSSASSTSDLCDSFFADREIHTTLTQVEGMPVARAYRAYTELPRLLYSSHRFINPLFLGGALDPELKVWIPQGQHDAHD
jgi:hypothetical protein